ncbi:DUF4047 domain-containing protein [Bacillus sp. AFS041924]|uniref:DUF4047 domain-containing protein n=1 Tax=Bacillus sp. AFS041924 TaxID=2033503 RepID=UPI000BFBA048|nr:DUF4047 domain-containing protein [Bacillus sp. AFS041924]PGS54458.1 hypothetical protein COC46_05200 [Bacillus sp. AFS041924]
MRNSIHKMIIFPCLCCISFYVGEKIVGETEASFTTKETLTPIEASTAFVFPSTINQLVYQSQEIAKTINNEYETIDLPSTDVSYQDLKVSEDKIKETDQKIRLLYKTLERNVDELSQFNSQIVNQKNTDPRTFDYVSKGYNDGLNILKNVQATVDFEYIEEVHSLISSQIKKLESETKNVQKQNGELK